MQRIVKHTLRWPGVPIAYHRENQTMLHGTFCEQLERAGKPAWPPHRPGYQCKMHHPIIWSHGLIMCCSDKHHIRPFALPVSITWSIIRSPCFPWKLSPTLDQQFHFTWLACPLSSRSIEQRSMPIWFSPLLYGVCLEVGDYLEGNNHTV